MQAARQQKLFLLIMISITLVLCLGVLEVGLRVATPFPIGNQSNKALDPVLGYVMSRAVTGVDRDGFRNPKVLAQADIVAIGDSHTYGYNAPPKDSWPAQLSTMLDTDVYNMGIGGYGILEYRELFNRARAKSPKTIVFSLYLQNDISNVCMTLENNVWWKNWSVANQVDISACGRPKPLRIPRGGVSDWFKKETALGSFMKYQRHKKKYARIIKEGHSDEGIVVSTMASNTLLSWEQIDGGISGMNIYRKDNALGLELMERVFGEIASIAAEKDIRTLAIFIPSKELVYYKTMLRAGTPIHEKLHMLAKNETDMTEQVRNILTKHAIPYTEIVADLSLAVGQEADIYPARGDGHPLSGGYRIYAEGVRKMIETHSKNR